MTTKQMEQISSAVNKLNGWGDLDELEVKITQEADDGEVVQFCIQADPEEEEQGPGDLYFTRVEHTNGWGMVSEYGGKLTLIV